MITFSSTDGYWADFKQTASIRLHIRNRLVKLEHHSANFLGELCSDRRGHALGAVLRELVPQ